MLEATRNAVKKRRTYGDPSQDRETKAAPFRAPTLTPQRRHDIERAARAHADVNRSDPNAYGRVKVQMEGGMLSPSDVLADALRIQSARGES